MTRTQRTEISEAISDIMAKIMSDHYDEHQNDEISSNVIKDSIRLYYSKSSTKHKDESCSSIYVSFCVALAMHMADKDFVEKCVKDAYDLKETCDNVADCLDFADGVIDAIAEKSSIRYSDCYVAFGSIAEGFADSVNMIDLDDERIISDLCAMMSFCVVLLNNIGCLVEDDLKKFNEIMRTNIAQA